MLLLRSVNYFVLKCIFFLNFLLHILLFLWYFGVSLDHVFSNESFVFRNIPDIFIDSYWYHDYDMPAISEVVSLQSLVDPRWLGLGYLY